MTFSPLAVTAYSGTVTVSSDKTSGTNTASISGTGTPPPTPGVFGNFKYTDNGTAITITGYITKPVSAMDIPATINGKPVTGIGYTAFGDCSGLTSVTIPNSVTRIGDYAFEECSGLTRAEFLGNAPTMGSGVFDSTGNGFTVYYRSGQTGFTSPTWNGYPASAVP